MKIDLVRQTPVPPPIESATITCSERELLIFATALLREGQGSMSCSVLTSAVLAWFNRPLVGGPVTEDELDGLKRKFKEALSVR
jgi:hypothetical protein